MSEIRNSWEDNLQFTKKPYMDIDEEIEALRVWMTERQTWINDNLDKLGIVRVTLTFMADDTVVGQRTVNAGFPMSQSYPDAPQKDGFTFVGWEPDGEVPENEDGYPYFWEDVIFTAKYLDNSESVKADNIWFEKDEFWVNVNDYYFYPIYTVTPDDAQIKDVVWSSSDNDTAEFSEYGAFELKKTGDAVLTATVNNEFSKSFTIHIYDGNVTPVQNAKSITLEKDTIRMKVGDYAQVAYSISPQPCFDLPMFEYDEDAGIIQLIDGIVFKALKPGTETVTVFVHDDVQAVCNIIVTDKDEPLQESSEESSEPSKEPSDEPSTEPSEASVPEQSDTPVIDPSDIPVRTGDSSMTLTVVMALISASCCIVLCIRIRRKN